ncbi:MgtC/SapB family protein [Acidithiobacillus sp. YTS05]|nr:MgtC/SapB family protein [Acidithiobacillus sp. YTS05]
MTTIPTMLTTTGDIFLAFVLGALIGIERQWRQRTAGLRTNTLVAVGAAIFVDLAIRMGGMQDAIRVVAYVVSGVGFLGAGTIMKEGANVRGLNTAATLWGSAAVGACSGAEQIFPALVAAAFVISANTLLRPVVNRINRAPLSETATELNYTFSIIVQRGEESELIDILSEELESAGYPLRDLYMHAFGEEETEMQAILLPNTVDAETLDRLVTKFDEMPQVHQAFWNQRTGD